MDSRRIPRVADRQADVFTRDQAYVDGWTRRQVRRRLEAGRWKVVAGATIARSDLPIGAWQLAFAVSLSWPGAVISHRLAAAIWGWPVAPGPVASATVAPAARLGGQRMRAFRGTLRDEEMCTVGGLRVTSEIRTAGDVLAGATWDEARDHWAWLVTHGRVTLDELRAEADRRSPRRGTPQLRRLIAVSAGGSLSAAEDLLHAILVQAGLVGWRANARIVVSGRLIGTVDVLFEAARVAIEVDGWSTHSDRQAFQEDRTKGNRLTAAGYVVLRFTWGDLSRRSEWVQRTIQATLATSRA